jgi:hypothetical protein
MLEQTALEDVLLENMYSARTFRVWRYLVKNIMLEQAAFCRRYVRKCTLVTKFV